MEVMLICDVLTLPRRVKEQPRPFINTTGDCGPCVLGALLDMEPAEVYAYLGVLPQPLDYHHVRDILYLGLKDQRLHRVIDDCPMWFLPASYAMYGPPSHRIAWFRYVQMALEGGYYGVCFVNLQEEGPHKLPNHLVLLCGIRKTTEHDIHRHEVLISCSARRDLEAEWVEVTDFLSKRGGYNVILVKP